MILKTELEPRLDPLEETLLRPSVKDKGQLEANPGLVPIYGINICMSRWLPTTNHAQNNTHKKTCQQIRVNESHSAGQAYFKIEIQTYVYYFDKNARFC